MTEELQLAYHIFKDQLNTTELPQEDKDEYLRIFKDTSMLFSSPRVKFDEQLFRADIRDQIKEYNNKKLN